METVLSGPEPQENVARSADEAPAAPAEANGTADQLQAPSVAAQEQHPTATRSSRRSERSRSRSPRKQSPSSRHKSSKGSGKAGSKSPKRRRGSKSSKSPGRSRSRSRRQHSSKSKSRSKSPGRKRSMSSRRRSPGSKRRSKSRSRSRSGSPKRRRRSPSRRRSSPSSRRNGGSNVPVLHASRAYAHRARPPPGNPVPGWVYSSRLRPAVQSELEALYLGGVLRAGGPQDLDPATMEHLRHLPEDAGVSALQELAKLDFSRLWNLSAFFVGICRGRAGQLAARGRQRSRSPPLLRTAGPPPWLDSPPGRPGMLGHARSPPGRLRSPLSPAGRPGAGAAAGGRGPGRRDLASPLGNYWSGSPVRRPQRSLSPAAGMRRPMDPYAMHLPPAPRQISPTAAAAGSQWPVAGAHSPRRGLPGPPGKVGRSPREAVPPFLQQPSPVSPLSDAAGLAPATYQAQQQAGPSSGRYSEQAGGGSPPPLVITSLAAWDAPAIPSASAAHLQAGWQQQEHAHYGYRGGSHAASDYPATAAPAHAPGSPRAHQTSNGYVVHADPYGRTVPDAGGYGASSSYAASAGPAGASNGYSPDGGSMAAMFDRPLSSVDQWPPGSALRCAVTDYVKELLKPAWKAQRISRDAYKAVAKKTVEKVLCSVAANGPLALPDDEAGVAQLFSERTCYGMQALVERHVALAERYGLERLLAAA